VSPGGGGVVAPAGYQAPMPPSGAWKVPVLVVGGIGVGFLAIVVFLVLAVSLLGTSSAERFESIGEPVDPAVPLVEDDYYLDWRALEALEPGDCMAADLGTSTDVTVVPCDSPHLSEVFAVEAIPEAESFPGDAELGILADDVCLGQGFTDFVGNPHADSTLLVTSFYPYADEWAEGFREIVCVVHPADPEVPTTGSFRDSGA
jgi:hypothetical protein